MKAKKVIAMNLNKCALFIAFFLLANLVAEAAMFTAHQEGDYDQKDIWTPRYPGNVIQEGDTVVINNEINHNIDIVVKGTLIIWKKGSLSGSNNLIIIKSGTLLNLGNSQFGAVTNRGAIYNEQNLEVMLDFVNSGNIINYKNVAVGNLLDNTGIITGEGGNYSADRKFINSRTGEIKGYVDVCSNNFMNMEGGTVSMESTTFCGNPIFNSNDMLSELGEPLHFQKSAQAVSIKTGEYTPF